MSTYMYNFFFIETGQNLSKLSYSCILCVIYELDVLSFECLHTMKAQTTSGVNAFTFGLVRSFVSQYEVYYIYLETIGILQYVCQKGRLLDLTCTLVDFFLNFCLVCIIMLPPPTHTHTHFLYLISYDKRSTI